MREQFSSEALYEELSMALYGRLRFHVIKRLSHINQRGELKVFSASFTGVLTNAVQNIMRDFALYMLGLSSAHATPG